MATVAPRQWFTKEMVAPVKTGRPSPQVSAADLGFTAVWRITSFITTQRHRKDSLKSPGQMWSGVFCDKQQSWSFFFFFSFKCILSYDGFAQMSSCFCMIYGLFFIVILKTYIYIIVKLISPFFSSKLKSRSRLHISQLWKCHLCYMFFKVILLSVSRTQEESQKEYCHYRNGLVLAALRTTWPLEN